MFTNRNAVLAFSSGIITLAFAFIISVQFVHAAGPWYVDASVSASGDGLSTTTALKTIEEAVATSTNGDTINVAAGTYGLSTELDITKPLTIAGQGTVTIKAVSDFGSTNGSKHLLAIYAGTVGTPVTISNIALDCDGKCFGVNVYDNASVLLNGVTITNSNGAGLTVNGSTVAATNLTTSGNAWGAVNVDPGSGVTTPSVFTLSGTSVLSEDNQVWSDGSNASGAATVTVNIPPDYSLYSILGTGHTFQRWMNKPLTSAISITEGTTTSYYASIQAAVDAASSTAQDTIVVPAGTYALNSRILINKGVHIIGAGDTTIITKGTRTWTNTTGTKGLAPLIEIENVTTPVTLENIKVTGAANIAMTPSGTDYGHGINIFNSSNVTLNGVTSTGNAAAGLIVNGSTVTATNLTTNGNAWGSVNVDPGSGVTTPSMFTLNSGTLGDDTQIWSDGDHVTASSTVAVNAAGYTKYAVSGTTKLVWANKSIPNSISITKNGTAVLYSTIQGAINAASTTTVDTINVGAGTYTGDLTVSRSVTLVGSGAPQVVGQVMITAPSVSFSGFSVTNPSGFGGIYVGPVNNVNISNNTIAHVGTTMTSSNTTQGIEVYQGASNVTISNNTISDIYAPAHKSAHGIYLGDGNNTGTISNVTISNNSISNIKSTSGTPWGTYGIQINHPTSGTLTISNNTISDMRGAWAHAVSFDYDAPNATVTGNTITDLAFTTGGTAAAFHFEDDVLASSTDSSTASVHNNFVDSSTVLLGVTNTTGGTINATNNYWATGTSSPAALMTGTVSFDPWYTDAAKSNLSNDTHTNATVASSQSGQANLPTGTTNIVLTNDTSLDVSSGVAQASGGSIDVGSTTVALNSFSNGDLSGVDLSVPQNLGDQSVTVTQAVNIQSGSSSVPVVLTNSQLASVSVSIPDNTTVLAGSGWDGTIAPPQTANNSGTAPSGFSVGSTVIEVGSPDTVLLFTKPVEVVLNGVTGTVAYRPSGSTNWVQITNTCGGSYTSPAAPTFPGECAISDGTNTKIETYHLTTFGSLNVVTPAPVSSGGGGGGIVGLLGAVTSSVSALPNNGGAAPTTGTVSTGAAGEGQVLGASVFNFAANLTVGVRSNDVTELQNVLISAGFLKASATGYFGPLTKAAVIAYQKAHALPQTGYVGTMTRAELNKGSTPTATDEQASMLMKLQDEVKDLLAKIAVLKAAATSTSSY